MVGVNHKKEMGQRMEEPVVQSLTFGRNTGLIHRHLSMGLQVEGGFQVEESLQIPSPWPVS